jgi:hypothetical protein
MRPRLVPALPVQLLAVGQQLLLLLLAPSPSRSQPHPPGTGKYLAESCACNLHGQYKTSRHGGGARESILTVAPLGCGYWVQAGRSTEQARPLSSIHGHVQPEYTCTGRSIVPGAACGTRLMRRRIVSVAPLTFMSILRCPIVILPRARRADAYVISTRLVDLADSTLSLWETTSSSGLDVAQLASDDDAGLGLASLLVFVPPRTGTLYVRVRGYSSVQLGHFNVTIVDATAGMDAVGPAPCVSSVGAASCVLPLGCIKSFNDNRDTCPGGGDGRFSCESLCAALLVPWYGSVEQECQQLLALMPEWHSYTALGDCNAAVYGGTDLAIPIRVGETQDGRIGNQGYREWFRFQASRCVPALHHIIAAL